jgi:hypothetical protein
MKIVLLRQTIPVKQLNHILPIAFALLVLLGITAACKDKPKPNEPAPCTSCETRMETKKYFLFDVGSWWVYKEETTHEKDSIYVINAANDPSSADFDVRYFSLYQNCYYHFFPLITVSSQLSGCSDNVLSYYKKCIYVKNSKYFPGDYVGEENCFFSQYYKTASTPAPNIHFSDNKIIFEEVYDTYSLPSLSFGKTLKVHVEHSQLEHDSPVNYYYVKGVGLIRKEIIDSNQVWNLVDYHVTQ